MLKPAEAEAVPASPVDPKVRGTYRGLSRSLFLYLGGRGERREEGRDGPREEWLLAGSDRGLPLAANDRSLEKRFL